MSPRVLIIGGGVAGLSAALALRGRAEVTLRESTAIVGGKLRKGPLGVDEGAEAFLFRLPEGVAAAAEAGLELAHPATSAASLWIGGRLRPLPTGTLMGIPGDLRAAAPVLGIRGTARAALDRYLPPSSVDDDPAVGGFVRARMGDRVVDRLVDPLLGGVYAGHADELSLRMTTPQLVPALKERSLLAAARRLRPKPTGAPVFASPVAGMGELAQRMAAVSDADIVLSSPVRDLDRDGEGWIVEGERYDAVVLAVPNAPARKLLAPLGVDVPTLSYASIALATFIFPSGTELPAGSGMLVPATEGRLIKASTFLSQKWAHIGDGVDGVVVRCSAGRAGEASELARSDRELAGVLSAEFTEATGVTAKPLATSVVRWGGGLPQYAPGHLERVASVRDALPRGLTLAGAAWDGVGVPACLRSGAAAAAHVAALVA